MAVRRLLFGRLKLPQPIRPIRRDRENRLQFFRPSLANRPCSEMRDHDAEYAIPMHCYGARDWFACWVNGSKEGAV